MAKNRLQKFYNPKLFAPKRALVEEATTFVQIKQHQNDAPPPPPATAGAFAKSDSSGVISMIDLLIKDIDKEMTEAKTMEKDSQSDYEKAMQDFTQGE